MTFVLFADQPRAQTEDGTILPFAWLWFYEAGTDTLRDVFADAQHDAFLENPVLADGGARFPPIYLNPDIEYRVMLERVLGVEIYDLDPFSGTLPGPSPAAPLSNAGLPLPFATLTVYRSQTTQLEPIYADDEGGSTLDNPLTADSAGVFPQMWLDDSIDYRVILNQQSGVLVWDVDDYLATLRAGTPQESTPPVITSVTYDFPEPDAPAVTVVWTAAVFPGSSVSSYDVYKYRYDGGDPPEPPEPPPPPVREEFVLFTSVPADQLVLVDTAVFETQCFYYFIVAVPAAGPDSDDSNIGISGYILP